MGWKDDLREASFKGIPFFVDKVEDEFGRRIVHNEFPGKEIGSIQDLGRKDDVYNITGFLFGDYAKNLESLEDALNESGSGALVHPYRAAANVVPDGYSVIRIKDDGGYAQINMRFIKAEFEGGIVITAQAEVADQKGNLTEIRSIFDAHTHKDSVQAPTTPPLVTMGG